MKRRRKKLLMNGILSKLQKLVFKNIYYKLCSCNILCRLISCYLKFNKSFTFLSV